MTSKIKISEFTKSQAVWMTFEIYFLRMFSNKMNDNSSGGKMSII